MTKKQIIDYVMDSPENTNPAILGQLIDEVEGGDIPIGNDTCIIKIIDDDETPFSTNDFSNFAKSIILPSNITSIDEEAFYGYLLLEDIIIPEGITTIGDYAFYSCPLLKKIVLPSSITNIGEMCFGVDIESITILATTPPTVHASWIEIDDPIQIYVPAESVDAYKEAENWDGYVDYIQPISNN